VSFAEKFARFAATFQPKVVALIDDAAADVSI
jgi:hypothetical protein